MTTKVTTNEVQVLKRTWSDLDPKVRNALDVWALTVLLVIGGLAIKSITLPDALYLLVPVTLAVSTAYITTSKHKELILTTATEAESIARKLPAPYAAPAVAVLDAVTTAATTSDPHEDDPHPEVPDQRDAGPSSASASPGFTQVISGSTEQPTQVLQSAAANFLAHLPSGQQPVADAH